MSLDREQGAPVTLVRERIHRTATTAGCPPARVGTDPGPGYMSGRCQNSGGDFW
ncbi:hypothetical protein KPATCC21470_4135 [Kitasatospora purpeofusca]